MRSASQLNRRQLLGGAAAALAAPALLGQTASARQTPQAVDGGTLRLGMNATIDPNTFASTTIPPVEEYVGARLASTAWTLDHQVPDLAESWEVVDDGNAYLFHLRPNLTWHDGEPFTADDVIWTITTGIRPETGSWMGNQLNDIVGYDDVRNGVTDALEGLTAVDPLTVRIDVVAPNATFLNRQSMINMLPRHRLVDIPLEELAQAQFFVDEHTMLGPYKWTSFDPQESIQLERYEQYHLGRPNISNVIFLPFADAESQLIALERGDIDAGSVPITELERFQALSHLDVLPLKGGVANWISVNTTKPEFADKRFRQAMAYAIDKATIIESLWKGLATPLYGHFVQDWAKSPDVNTYDHNPELAKQLLADIGWDSNRVVDFTYYYADAHAESLVVAMQAFLEQVGIRTSLRLIDTATVAKEVDQDNTFDIMYGALGVQLDPDQATAGVTSDRFPPAGANRSRWANADLDAAMLRGRQSLDQAERAVAYHEAELILNDELPFVWLWEPLRPQAINKRVVGMADHQGLVSNMSAYRAIHEWWLQS